MPTIPVAEPIRRVIERAWFEHATLSIRYRAERGAVTTRTVRLQSVVMERSLTLLNCWDLDKGEARQFRLERVEAAVIAETEP